MEIPELTDAILSDDYEEGEILDEDTLYDNVSSLEEFSGSDADQKSHGEYSSINNKKSSSDGRKEKHHRRKEHKCKEDSICRKERSGKHCYARIRKSKITAEVTEKTKVVDLTSMYETQNHKKKTHVLSPVHDAISKYNSRRLPTQRDLPEKENKYSHRYPRYHDSHKSAPHKVDKKKYCEKLRKQLVTGSSCRSHENRKRARSQSPKTLLKNHVKDMSSSRGCSSLLKRLVGSGSIGVKTPKEIEEPKKVDVIAVLDRDKSIIETNKTDVHQDKTNMIIEVVDNEVMPNGKDGVVVKEFSDLEISEPEKGDYVEDKKSEIVVGTGDKYNEGNQDIATETFTIDPGGSISTISNETDLPVEIEGIKEVSDSSQLPDNPNQINNKNGSGSDIISNKKNGKEITEDIDELNLRLEALRTAMLRKHRERKKRGFICKKKSSIEDDSFTEYVLGYDNNDEELIEDKDGNDAEKKKEDKDSNVESLSENFSDPQNILLESEASDNIPLQFNCLTDDPVSLYSKFNENFPFEDFSPTPIPEDKINSILKNQLTNHSLSNCLKEINSNNETYLESNKRVKRLSSKFKSRKRKELDNKKWHYGRTAMKRKLARKEFADQKRRRREYIRDIKIIRTNDDITKKINEGSDEECTLRELALKSVKMREKTRNVEDAELVQKINDSDLGDTIKVGNEEIFNNLHIEIDNTIGVKPLVSCDSESTPTNLSSNEAWDDIDEDILRAQLLSSLSSKIPIKDEENTKTFTPVFSKKQAKALLKAERKCLEIFSDKKLKIVRQKINKENFKKIPKNKSTDTAKRKSGLLRVASDYKKPTDIKQACLNAKKGPVVPKFIISLKGDSSSEDDMDTLVNDDKSDVVRSIDLFLQEARVENDLKQNSQSQEIVTSFKPNEKKLNLNKHIAEVKVNSNDKKKDTSGGGTPQVLKHLPAWQQEEYRRLKKQIAEKEKVLKAAKEKVLIPVETEELEKETTIVLKSDDFKNNMDKMENDNNKNINVETVNSSGVLKDDLNSTDETKQITANNDLMTKLVDPQLNLKPPINSPKTIDSAILMEEVNNITKISIPQLNLKQSLQSPKQIDRSKLSQEVNYIMTKNEPVQINSKPSNTSSGQIFDSTKLIQEVNQMSKMVENLEKEMSNFRDIYKTLVQKKKEFLITKLNMARKKKVLFEIKKILISKEKLIQAKMEHSSLLPVSKVDQNEAKKIASRDLELCKLRMREFNLRTKIIFNEIDLSGPNKMVKQSKEKESLSTDKTKLILKAKLDGSLISDKISDNPLQSTINSAEKFNINEAYSNPNKSLGFIEKPTENWDPFVPICPFDLSGVCKDEECKFQHIKAS